MLEGLLAAIALFFSPHADEVRAPEPLVSFYTGPSQTDIGVYRCKSPPFLWVEVIGHDRIAIRYIDTYGLRRDRVVLPAELSALLKKAGTDELGDRVFISASDDIPYGDVVAQVGFLKSLGVRKIALIG